MNTRDMVNIIKSNNKKRMVAFHKVGHKSDMRRKSLRIQCEVNADRFWFKRRGMSNVFY